MLRANETFLQAVHSVAGVTTSYLINNRGEVLAGLGHRPASDEASGLAVRLVQMLAALEMVEGTCGELALSFDQSTLTLYCQFGLVFETKYGSEEVFLAVVTTPKVNPSMWRMTIRVATTKLKSEPDMASRSGGGQFSRRNLLQKNYLDEAGVEMLKALARA